VGNRKTIRPKKTSGPWPHRLAWTLACAVAAMIVSGGLVTSYDAGMDFVGWFRLPRGGPTFADQCLNYTHRALADLVLLAAIAAVAVSWRLNGRKSTGRLAVAALLAVIAQGVLCGARMILDEPMIADAAACTAPLLLALSAALVTVTSPAWQQRDAAGRHPAARLLQRWSAATTLGLYLLIVLGAQLRHPWPEAWYGWCLLWIWSKVILAGVISIGVAGLLVYVLRRAGDKPVLVRRAELLGGLLAVQIILGIAAWVTNFGWPAWFRNYVYTFDYTIAAEGPLQVLSTTAHVAFGSLSLAVSVVVTMWSLRLLRPNTACGGKPDESP